MRHRCNFTCIDLIINHKKHIINHKKHIIKKLSHQKCGCFIPLFPVIFCVWLWFPVDISPHYPMSCASEVPRYNALKWFKNDIKKDISHIYVVTLWDIIRIFYFFMIFLILFLILLREIKADDCPTGLDGIRSCAGLPDGVYQVCIMMCLMFLWSLFWAHLCVAGRWIHYIPGHRRIFPSWKFGVIKLFPNLKRC